MRFHKPDIRILHVFVLSKKYQHMSLLTFKRGRAGRVREGSCYKLISSSLHKKLPEHGEPEVRRCALDQSILSLLFLGLENGSGDFLRIMLDPPSKESIQSAFNSLEKIGAVSRNGDLLGLTPLGTHLAGIPAPPTVGKLIIMGCLLGCRDLVRFVRHDFIQRNFSRLFLQKLAMNSCCAIDSLSS